MSRCAVAAVCVLLLAARAGHAAAARADTGARDADAPLRLTPRQQAAVGLELRRPVAMTLPLELHGFATVLDAAAALADLDARTSAAAGERAAAAEAARLGALYRAGAGASLKDADAARAVLATAHGHAATAAARFTARWAPLDALGVDRCRRLILAAIRGRAALLQAELPGRHAIGTPPASALVDIDGVQAGGRVLGAMRSVGGTRNAALLIEVRRPPAGLGAGSRLPVALLWGRRSGRLVPASAVLYGSGGAYVYRRLPDAAHGPGRFEPVPVRLLVPYGEAWLVEGLGEHDEVVVRGAGVLWSLQGLGSQADDDDD